MTAASGAENFDILVVGAGPAGSAAAVTACRKGLRVALVDKQTFPRHKLCGGGITGRAMGHYRRIFGQDLPDAPLLKRDRIAFHAFGQDLGEDKDAPPIYLGMRQSFDAALVDHALALGATNFTGQSGEFDPNTLSMTLPMGKISAPIVIAADGVNSPIARQVFGEAFDRRHIGFALEIEHAEGDSAAPLRIDFGAADWGYGWHFPKTSGVTIGVGGVKARNPDMKAALAHYLDCLNIGPDQKVKGQFLPFGEFRKIPGQGRILFAGDAAGLVDPITGEGIAHALHSGALAADAAATALRTGRPDEALGIYRSTIAPIHRSLGHARRLRPLLFRKALRPAFIRSFRQSRTLRRDYLRLLGGEIEYSTLMRRTAARLPRFAWRAILGR